MTFKVRRTMIISTAALVLAAGLVGTAVLTLIPKELAAEPVFADDGLAIRGTDPVAYFTEERPVKGSSEFSTEWNGVTWHFASEENRSAFLGDPEKYAPQYGGYCAWGLAAKGKFYSTKPEAWSIVDGKLYLNYSKGVRSTWEKDIPGHIADGDRLWEELKDQPS